MPANIQIQVKVLIHKQHERVVFAEANSDFVDILFSFLTLPMGTIARRLSNNHSQPPFIWSFNNLYGSMTNLEAKYFATQACKDMLIHTRNSAVDECQKLRINVDYTSFEPYLRCEDPYCTAYFSIHMGVKCKKCSKLLSKSIDLRSTTKKVGGQDGIFVCTTASFVITDDLCVFPNIPASTFAMLNNSGYTDFGELEEKTFNIGYTEIIHLLKSSILSKTPLTTMFLGKNDIMSGESVETISRPVNTAGISFEKFVVKVLVQKSSNRLLLAFSSKDFVDFLFTLLAVPLGRVISLLSEYYIPALCVENLYRSVSGLNVGEYFSSQQMKDLLLVPQLDMLYLSSNQLFPLPEEMIPKFYHCTKYSLTTEYASGYPECKFASPLGEGGLLNGSTKFMVTDDLVVTPLSSLSCIKFLQKLNISPSDTEELVIEVGIKEAISLLRATLNSASVLTNGLGHLFRRNP